MKTNLATLAQVLIFSGNELARLGDDAFPARNLDDLQELNLSGCGLGAVSARALRGLANLGCNSIDIFGWP